MTIKLHIDTVGFKEKPKKEDVASIKPRLQGRITPQDFHLDDILRAITDGKTISPSVLVGGIGAINWVQQQLFLVDIDNEKADAPILSIDDIQNICKQNNLKICFIYHSFSSSKEKEKYRVAFLCDRVITSEKERKLIIETLVKLFPQADTSCTNADRLFYGTNKEIIYVDENATFSIDDILNIQATIPEEKTQNYKEEEKKYDIDLQPEIDKFDFLSFLKSECGEIAKETSKYIMFKNCPICKHKDDFVYFKDKNIFRCFGGNGNKEGGDIIRYLMYTKNMEKGDAIRYFLYDILHHEKPQWDNFTPFDKYKYVIKKTRPEVEFLYKKFHTLKLPPHKYSLDDKGLGELFALVIMDFLRYNVTRGSWMYHNGKVWVDDVGSSIVNKWAKHFKDALYLYSCDDGLFNELGGEEQQREALDNFRKYIASLGYKNRRDTIIKDSQSEYPIRNEQLDANNDLFNCNNGTLNMKTLEFREHRAEDLLSKIANVNYNRDASKAFFEKFMGEIMENNPDKIKFLKRALGYSLTAETKEETFFILHGSTTRNGKSTLVETIMYMLGDYAKQVNPETLAVKKFSDSRTASGDVARLCGARFINLSEPAQDMVLNVAQVKVFTGGDTITARNLYEKEMQFKPVFKIFMNTNHLPQVNDDTLFKSGRVNVIKFDRHFSPDEQDKSLKAKLKQDEVLSGVLNWCIEGLQDYREQGLNPPLCVIEANEEYQGYADLIRRFIDDCFCESENNTKLGDVYALYCKWCKNNGLFAEPKPMLRERLENKGFTATIKGTRYMLKGLEIKSTYRF